MDNLLNSYSEITKEILHYFDYDGISLNILDLRAFWWCLYGITVRYGETETEINHIAAAYRWESKKPEDQHKIRPQTEWVYPKDDYTLLVLYLGENLYVLAVFDNSKCIRERVL
jgi:hypothetical protein